MSMLSEPKRKTKWTLNPRGTLWSNDENKFGQKVLEKMGWSKGKGLGKEGQGSLEPLKVSSKDNNQGVGYKGADDNTTSHFDAYEDVLSQLNNLSESNSGTSSSKSNSNDGTPGESDEEVKAKYSLEKLSKESRARVHYHKFTRGKDTSSYNEDDLACILGSKRSSKKKKKSSYNVDEPLEQNNCDTVVEPASEDQKEELDTSQRFINAGDLKSYFAKKMTELKRKREEGILAQGQNDFDPEESCYQIPNLEFTPMKKDFSFNFPSKLDDTQELNKDNTPKLEKKKKKKNKDKEKEFILQQEQHEECSKEKKKKNKDQAKEFIPQQDLKEECPKEKKKKSKEIDVTQDDFEEANLGMERYNKKMKKGHMEECLDVNESEYVKKKKKKYRQAEDYVEENLDNRIKKKNKKKTFNIEEINHIEANDNVSEKNEYIAEEITNQDDSLDMEVDNKKNEAYLEEYNHRPIKKKKKKSKSSSEINQPATQSNDLNESYFAAANTDEHLEKFKKGKAKRHAKEIFQDEQPLKKLKKFTSDIAIGDVFKLKDITTEQSEAIEEKKPKKKLKLSAKESFRSIVDLGEKFKKYRRDKNAEALDPLAEEKETVNEINVGEKRDTDNERDDPNKPKKKRKKEKYCHGILSEDVTHEQEMHPERQKKKKCKKNKDSPEQEKRAPVSSHQIDLSRIFPGSNLHEIKGYPV